MIRKGSDLIVGVSSDSAAEIGAATDVLTQLEASERISGYIISTVNTGSGGPQPFSNHDLRQEARAQADAAFEADPRLHCAYGIEGGMVRIAGDSFYQSAVVLVEKGGKATHQYSAPIYLPEWLVAQVEKEKTRLGMGEVLGKLVGRKDGALHMFLSGDLATYRGILYLPMLLCLQQHLNHEVYGSRTLPAVAA